MSPSSAISDMSFKDDSNPQDRKSTIMTDLVEEYENRSSSSFISELSNND
jgi:hypothetical protein